MAENSLATTQRSGTLGSAHCGGMGLRLWVDKMLKRRANFVS